MPSMNQLHASKKKKQYRSILFKVKSSLNHFTAQSIKVTLTDNMMQLCAKLFQYSLLVSVISWFSLEDFLDVFVLFL